MAIYEAQAGFTVPAVWQQYLSLKDGIELVNRIAGDAEAAHLLPDDWIGLTLAEVRRRVRDAMAELEMMVMLSLLSVGEAHLRTDFLDRSQRKRRDVVSRDLARLYKRSKARRTPLEEIIEVWKSHKGNHKFSDFISAMRLRDWLAHGRYWNARTQLVYTPVLVHQITTDMIGLAS